MPSERHRNGELILKEVNKFTAAGQRIFHLSKPYFLPRFRGLEQARDAGFAQTIPSARALIPAMRHASSLTGNPLRELADLRMYGAPERLGWWRLSAKVNAKGWVEFEVYNISSSHRVEYRRAGMSIK